MILNGVFLLKLLSAMFIAITFIFGDIYNYNMNFGIKWFYVILYKR